MDNIVLMMISFFIDEMEENGIVSAKDIGKLFDENNEKEFKKMISEYKKLQSLTRNKAVKKVIELKKKINNLKSDIKISE